MTAAVKASAAWGNFCAGWRVFECGEIVAVSAVVGGAAVAVDVGGADVVVGAAAAVVVAVAVPVVVLGIAVVSGVAVVLAAVLAVVIAVLIAVVIATAPAIAGAAAVWHVAAKELYAGSGSDSAYSGGCAAAAERSPGRAMSVPAVLT